MTVHAITSWQGCYETGWQRFLPIDAYQHPAKVAHGLAERIYLHLLAGGYLRPGDLVVDPFAGVGGFAFHAMSNDFRFLGVELEAKFVALANGWECPGTADPRDGWPVCVACMKSRKKRTKVGPHHAEGTLEYWRRRWSLLGATIIQGDSRRLREMVGPMLAGAVISSPPYSSGAVNDRCGIDMGRSVQRPGGPHTQAKGGGYGPDPSNLGNLPAGNVDAVVSSPPFEASDNRTPGPCLAQACEKYGVGTSHAKQDWEPSEGNLGNLPAGNVDAVVSSPPWARQMNEGGAKGDPAGNIMRSWALQRGHDPDSPSQQQFYRSYGDVPGQLGNTTGETFWAASKQIVIECWHLLRPGAVAVWVVKPFVRNNQIVDFPGDWRRLCEACGFVLMEEIHASLVKETWDRGLFEPEVTRRKQRKGFFRRLAEKRGAPPIDHEVVLILRKDEA